MSDDLPPPDLTKTADVPLDGLLPFNADPAGEVPADSADSGATPPTPLFEAEPPTAERETLFGQAKSLRLSSSEFVVDNPILEDEPRPTTGPLPQAEQPAEPLSALRALWEESHDRGVPFYRRQGPVAGLGLLALLIIGAVSFPWTRATIESGVVILIDDSGESAAVGSSSANREEFVEGPASGTMVMGTKSTTAAGSAEGFQSTSSQIASTSGIAAAPIAPTQAGPVATTEPPGPVSAETTTTAVIVAPVQLSCEDPAAVPPACAPLESPATTVPPTPPVTDEPVTPTTEPEPERTTTTEAPTTTEEPTTTKPEPTTATTEPDDDDTTTTTEPDDDDTTTTTTEPDDDDTTTTTTTRPDDDTIPDTTEPPIDSGGSVPTAVNCTPTTQPGPSVTPPPVHVC